jgi:ATP-binding cassette subfamily B protein
MMRIKSFPWYKQPDQMDCGPTCLKMIAKFFDVNITLQDIRDLCQINRDGVSLLGISKAAERVGFRTLAVKIDASQLRDLEMPCILHWKQNHFVILYKIAKDKFFIADPAVGLLALDEKEFNTNWLTGNKGIALQVTPTPELFERDQESEQSDLLTWSFLLRYLSQYRKLLVQLLLSLILGSLFQLIIPFLAQSIVDIGINTRNINFISVILIAQLILIVGKVTVDFIRAWILLHISTRVNISVLTDFLIKLMKLPMKFFDSKMTGDIMQRMNDQRKIETFLTGSTLSTIFSFFNLVLFSLVLAYYNLLVFFLCLGGSLFNVLWIFLFLKRRRILNYKSFELAAKNQSAIVQLVNGMQEIKLNNCEHQKRWQWEHLQARMFKFNIKLLALSQYQQGGGTFITEGINVIITFLSANAVINGHLTFGGMIAVQYIVGQMNSPIRELLNFVQTYQDARISLERLNEIHAMEDEQSVGEQFEADVPEKKDISIQSLSFCYPGVAGERILDDISLYIPNGKTTAIVGKSGSGKTTILKLLLRFYEPDSGQIKIGGRLLNTLSFSAWRDQCGVVMQDGFIFSDTITQNIAVGHDKPDSNRLRQAVKTANLQDLIEKLPMGLETKIGPEGNGISHGQRQRILIARAVYKNPQYLFFDEATNALDANNEKTIMGNLQEFFVGRTVIVVAHRLSTVRNADHIIFLHKGKIAEQGTHDILTSFKGEYYQLVKDQLALGV